MTVQKIDLHQDLIQTFYNDREAFGSESGFADGSEYNAGGLKSYREANLQIVRAAINPYSATATDAEQSSLVYDPLILDAHLDAYEKLRQRYNLGLITSANQVTGTTYIDYGLRLVYHLKGADSVKSLQDLQLLKDKGIRSIAPVRGHSNALAQHRSAGNVSGLTELGQEAIRWLQDQGIIVDVAGMNESSMLDTLRIARRPIIHSHTNPWTLHHHESNVRDSFLRAIADTEGVVGLSLDSASLSGRNPHIADYLDHIQYLRDLVGDDHIALGSGLHSIKHRQILAEIDEVAHLNRLEEVMVVRFGHKFVQKFFWENAQRVLMQGL